MNDFHFKYNLPKQDRRNFLKNTGHLIVGFTIMPLAYCTPGSNSSAPTTAINTVRRSAGPKAIDSWIRLDTNGYVTVLTGKMELGQGIRTALSQMAAEELDVDMSKIRIITADTGITPNERYTAGSGSIENSGRSIRNAAAEARKKLLELASEKYQVPVTELRVENGIIKVHDSNKSISYWDILEGKHIEGEVTGDAPLKDPSTYKLIGTAQPREDIIAMATGLPVYVHDLRMEGMLHARVLRPPVYKARLISLDSSKAEVLPGVVKLIRNGSFIAVVAEQEFQAIKALRLLEKSATWNTEMLRPQQEDLFKDMKNNSTGGDIVSEKGSVESVLKLKHQPHEATYTRPYHMHGSIGPSCAVAQYIDEQLTVWSPTQGVFPLRQTISDMTGISEDHIRVTGVQGSGCYGHNGADDVSADAALIAIEIAGKPVRVQWMREDEHRWEPYGSAMIISIQGTLNKRGEIQTWKSGIWSDTHSTRPGGRAGHFIAARDLEKPFAFSAGGFSGGSYRNGVPYYDIPDQEITLFNYSGPLRSSALRGLGAYANIFAMESFMDEMAIKAGIDPVEFRLKHLTDPRARAVIEKLSAKAGWGKKTKTGAGLGFAFARYKNTASYFAVVAEVEIDKANQKIKLIRLTGCIDAGQVINSDGIKNQTSGGMIQSASWTMLEQVKYNDTGITSSNWDTYPIMRFEEVPETEVILIDRPDQPPLGAGEAAQGPTAAAIVNAIFNAVGLRVRDLPVSKVKLPG